MITESATIIERSRLMAPQIISIGELGAHPPVGIRFLGGTALFNPDNQLLDPAEKYCAAYALLGGDNQLIGNELEITQTQVSKTLMSVCHKLFTHSRSGIFWSALQGLEPPMVISTPAPADRAWNVRPLERQVMELIPEGKTDHEISVELQISHSALHSSMNRIRQHFGFARRELIGATAILTSLSYFDERDMSAVVAKSRKHYFSERQRLGAAFQYRRISLDGKQAA